MTPNTDYFYRVVALNDAGESPASNVLGGRTRRLTLTAPTKVAARLLDNGQIEVTWLGNPPGGASAVIEGRPEGQATFDVLGTSPAAGPFHFFPTQVMKLSFRVKFVLVDQESPYGDSVLEINLQSQLRLIFLPLVRRGP